MANKPLAVHFIAINRLKEEEEEVVAGKVSFHVVKEIES